VGEFKEELQLIEIMAKIDKNIIAMCELFGGDVELFDDALEDMEALLVNLLMRKGVYADIDLVTCLVDGGITFEEILELSDEVEKELRFGN